VNEDRAATSRRVRQRLSSQGVTEAKTWEDRYQVWRAFSDIKPYHVVRYEDLEADPEGELRAIIEWAFPLSSPLRERSPANLRCAVGRGFSEGSSDGHEFVSVADVSRLFNLTSPIACPLGYRLEEEDHSFCAGLVTAL